MVSQKIRIIHCFRSPVGGIFRHVRDLIDAQIAEGHEVGILCDSITGGEFEEKMIRDVTPKLALGVHRITMRRSIAPSDLLDMWRSYALVRDIRPDVLHGHGAKGGAYARLVGTASGLSGGRTARLYTPHGGSMHYDPKTLGGWLFFRLERLLEHVTDHLLFVSQYEADAYRKKVGKPAVAARVVYNGLSPAEFAPVTPDPDAADFIYLGMLRSLKGPDILIRAIAEMAKSGGPPATAVIVGAGPEKPDFMKLADDIAPGLVRFVEPRPAREALRLGRVMVLPSRADSLPYVLLEALAADRPVIAVDVGGVSEIIPRHLQPLVAACDSLALAEAMAKRLQEPLVNSSALRHHIQSVFSIERMVGDTMAAYHRALAGPRAQSAGDRPAAARQTRSNKS